MHRASQSAGSKLDHGSQRNLDGSDLVQRRAAAKPSAPDCHRETQVFNREPSTYEVVKVEIVCSASHAATYSMMRSAAVEAKSNREGQVMMTFRFVLYDEPGVDKRVDVAIEVLRGEEHVGETGLLKNIKLGEKKQVTKSIEVGSVAAELQRQPKPTVQITTVVRDD